MQFNIIIFCLLQFTFINVSCSHCVHDVHLNKDREIKYKMKYFIELTKNFSYKHDLSLLLLPL